MQRYVESFTVLSELGALYGMFCRVYPSDGPLMRFLFSFFLVVGAFSRLQLRRNPGSLLWSRDETDACSLRFAFFRKKVPENHTPTLRLVYPPALFTHHGQSVRHQEGVRRRARGRRRQARAGGAAAPQADAAARQQGSEGGTIQLEALIELKLLNSSFSSLSSYSKGSLSSDSRQQ